jgi:hypothetical protein
MLPVPHVMSTNKMVLSVKDRQSKYLQLNPRIPSISTQDIKNIRKSDRKDQVITGEVPHMGEDIRA